MDKKEWQRKNVQETKVFDNIIWNWMMEKKNITIKTGMWREQTNRRIQWTMVKKAEKVFGINGVKRRRLHSKHTVTKEILLLYQ
jgi:hypothetical protein